MNKLSIINYQLSGKVIQGDSFGKKLGFPTANLDRRDFVRRKLKIKFGVYAGQAEFKIKNSRQQSPAAQAKGGQVKLKIYPAGIVIGPFDKKGLPKIEAHLIGFKGNLYGKKITIFLQKYLRPYKKFKNMEELKKQIKKDIQRIRKLVS